MCGGSGTTTQQVSIPPEVLARYNAVNAQAQQVAQQPFHIYSTDPSAFVAPINPQQMAGIENINQAANIPVPYFGAATQYLTGAAGAAQPYFDYASQQLTGGTQAGLAGTAAAYNPMAAGAQYAQGLQGGALGQYGAATAMAQPYNYLAGQNIMGAQAGAEPYQQAATTFGLAGATPVMPGQLGAEQINRYMSPYMSNVVEATLAPLRQQQQIEQSTLAGQQVGAGAYGGERGRIAQAVLAQQQNLATAKAAADLLQQGYGQALGTAQQQQQLGLGAEQANRQAIQQAAQQMLGIGQQGFGQGLASSQALSGLGQQVYGQQAGYGQNLAQLAQQGFGQGAAQTAQQAALAQQLYGMGTGTAGQAATLGQGVYGLGANTAQSLAGLGSGAQQAALQGAQAQIGAGTLGQQTQQAGLQALYNQFLQQQGYPFQVAQFLANIAMGTGALSGTTTQTTQPMGFLGSLSDKRAKEDIEPIGKTYDGQDIVKYRYKGQPQKQIGLIAQDVEKHHPEAVGLAGGLKTVDYDRATKDAAEIGKSSEGGKVIPFPDRRGYFDGGAAGGLSPTQIGEILAAQANMYGEYNHPGLGKGSGTTPGLGGYVPGASLPVGELMSPSSVPALPKATLQDVDAGLGIYKKGKELFGGSTKSDEISPRSVSASDISVPELSEEDLRRLGTLPGLYRGGVARNHYAIGGEANAPYGGNDMPYGDEDTKSNVPTSIPGLAGASKMEKPELMKPASPPSSSGSSDLGDLATLAKFAMMFAANGGRINKDDGGGAFLNPAGDFDAEKERNRLSALNQYGRLIPDNSVQTAAIERSPVLERFMQGQIEQPSNISAPDTIAPSAPGLGGEQISQPKATRATYDTEGYQKSDGLGGYSNPDPIGLKAGLGNIFDLIKRNFSEESSRANYMRGTQGLSAAKSDLPVLQAPSGPVRVKPNLSSRVQTPRPVPTPTPRPGLSGDELFSSANADGASARPSIPPISPDLVGSPTYQGGLSLQSSVPPSAKGMMGGDVAGGLAGAPATPQAEVLPPKDKNGERDFFTRAGDYLAPKGGFFDLLSQGKEEAVIPVLRGLGAAATADNRYLLGSLLAGAGAGAAAYQPTKLAQAQVSQARSAAQKAAITAAKESIFTINGVPYFLTADGNMLTATQWRQKGMPTLLGGERAIMVAKSQLEKEGGPQPQNTLPTPGTEKNVGAEAMPAPTSRIDPDIYNVAEKEVQRMESLPQDARNLLTEANQEHMEKTRAARDNAVIYGDTLNEGAKSFFPQFKNGILTPGAGQDKRAAAVNVWNTLMRGLGYGANATLEENLGEKQVAEKVTAVMAGLRTQGIGQTALASLQAVANGIPNGKMNQIAVSRVMADMYIQNQRAIDYAQFLENYSASHPEAPYIIGQGAQTLFNKKYNERYEVDRRNLEKLFQMQNNSTGEPLVNYLFGKGKDKNLQAKLTPERFEKEYSGITRYITRIGQ